MTTDAQSTFQDNPYLVWLPIAACAGLGIGFLIIGAREMVERGPSLPALGALSAGLVGLACSYLFTAYAESIAVTFDRTSRQIRLVGRLPWQRREASWAFEDVEAVEPERWDGVDGGQPMHRAVLVLKNGERIPLIANWHRDQQRTLELCQHALSVLQS